MIVASEVGATYTDEACEWYRRWNGRYPQECLGPIGAGPSCPSGFVPIGGKCYAERDTSAVRYGMTSSGAQVSLENTWAPPVQTAVKTQAAARTGGDGVAAPTAASALSSAVGAIVRQKLRGGAPSDAVVTESSSGAVRGVVLAGALAFAGYLLVRGLRR